MKKVIFIVLPLIVILGAGAVVGLNYVGILKIPFLPHQKVAKKTTKKTTVAAKPVPPPKKADPIPPPTPPPKPKVEVVKPDVEAGEKKLATLWEAMDAAQLVPIVQDWKDPDVARILVRMDAGKVTEFLAALDPVRASKLSRAIEAAAAKPKPTATPGT